MGGVFSFLEGRPWSSEDENKLNAVLFRLEMIHYEKLAALSDEDEEREARLAWYAVRLEDTGYQEMIANFGKILLSSRRISIIDAVPNGTDEKALCKLKKSLVRRRMGL